MYWTLRRRLMARLAAVGACRMLTPIAQREHSHAAKEEWIEPVDGSSHLDLNMADYQLICTICGEWDNGSPALGGSLLRHSNSARPLNPRP